MKATFRAFAASGVLVAALAGADATLAQNPAAIVIDQLKEIYIAGELEPLRPRIGSPS
jgi:hypothetical protein